MAQLNYFLVIGDAGLDRLNLAFHVALSLLQQGSWNVEIYEGASNIPRYTWLDQPGATRLARVQMITQVNADSNRDSLSKIWQEVKVAV